MPSNPTFPLATAFLASLVANETILAPGSATAQEQLEQQLAEILRAARERWPTVAASSEALTSSSFVAFLAAKLATPDSEQITIEEIADELAKRCTDDMYLSCSCLHTIAEALYSFEEKIVPRVKVALRSMDKNGGTLTEEAIQELRWVLFVQHDTREPRISQYQGKGALGKWVQVVAVGLAIGLQRKEKRGVVVRLDNDVLEAMPEIVDDPELAYIREHYGDKLREATHQALAALTPQQRVVLKYHYVEKLKVKAIASIYQVHNSTIVRQLQTIRETMARTTRRLLKKDLDVRTQELMSILRFVPSQITLGLQTMDFSEEKQTGKGEDS